MKRILVTILAFLYLASASGATIHIHYCMGKLVSASLLESSDDACGKCGMKKSGRNNCCKDEHKIIKASGDQSVSKNITVPVVYVADAATQLPVTFSPNVTYPCMACLAAISPHASPSVWRGCPIYIAVGNFRI